MVYGIAALAGFGIFMIAVLYVTYYHVADPKHTGLTDQQISLVNKVQRMCDNLVPPDPQWCQDDITKMTQTFKNSN